MPQTSCGPFCGHPDCWKNGILHERNSVNVYETKKQSIYALASNNPKLTIQSLDERQGNASFLHFENRVPSKHLKLIKSLADRTPEPTAQHIPGNVNFAEMQLFFKDIGTREFDNPIYQYIPRAKLNTDSSNLYADFFVKENTHVVHTVNIAVPSQAPVMNGIIPPPPVSVKARGLYRANRSPRSREYADDMFENPASEALLHLIASSKNTLSPRETPLPAEQAYKKYASTMLPNISRSDSVQTIIQRNDLSSASSRASTTRSKQRSRLRQGAIPLTALTLRLEGNNAKVQTVTDRKLLIPSTNRQKFPSREFMYSRVDSTLPRAFSGLSMNARQGSVKPSTASSEIGHIIQRPSTPESIDLIDDPLGYLAARLNLPENVSNASDRGTEGSMPCPSGVDSPTSSLNGLTKVVIRDATSVEKINLPPDASVEDVLLIPSALMSPDSAATASARAPPATPQHDGDMSASSVGAGRNFTPLTRPASPPWPGLYVFEAADDSLMNSRAPSVIKRGSPTSGMSTAYDQFHKELTSFSLTNADVDEHPEA